MFIDRLKPDRRASWSCYR